MGLPVVLLSLFSLIGPLVHEDVSDSLYPDSLDERATGLAIPLAMVVCMGMIALSLPPQTDVERTWECVSGSQEILLVHVLDDYEHCLDGSDEYRSGFFDDSTEAEEAPASYEILTDIFGTWVGSFLLAILCAIVYFAIPRIVHLFFKKGDSRRVRAEKLIRSEASKKRKREAKKKQATESLQALKKLPKRIEGIEKSIEKFDRQIEDFQSSLNSTRDEISSANDQIKHLVPYI
jgi:hypothetical protein